MSKISHWKEHVYSPVVIENLNLVARGLLHKPEVVDVPEDYLKNAGRVAQIRAAEAGYRLAGVWKECLGEIGEYSYERGVRRCVGEIRRRSVVLLCSPINLTRCRERESVDHTGQRWTSSFLAPGESCCRLSNKHSPRANLIDSVPKP